MKNKPLSQSKTFWVNFLAVAGMVTVYVLDHNMLTPDVAATVVTLQSLVNMVLRTLTTSPVDFK